MLFCLVVDGSIGPLGYLFELVPLGIFLVEFTTVVG